MITINETDWHIRRHQIIICCPECEREFPLEYGKVLADGTVTTGVGCPYDDCDFHSRLTLENWGER